MNQNYGTNGTIVSLSFLMVGVYLIYLIQRKHNTTSHRILTLGAAIIELEGNNKVTLILVG